MARKKKTFYEEMVFDDAQLALDAMEESEEKLVKAKRGLWLAVGATIYNLFGFAIVAFLLNLLGIDYAESFEISLCIAIGLTLASYILGGGFGTAVKWAWKLAIFGWIIIPFPYDLIVGFMTMGFSLACFAFIPILFVFINYRQIKKDYAAAKKYLSYYKAKNPSAKENFRYEETSYNTHATSTAERSYSSERGSEYRSSAQRNSMNDFRNQNTRTEVAPSKKVQRTFNSTYQRAYDEVSKKTNDIKIAKEKLSARKGANNSVERLFADLQDKQYDLNHVYDKTSETVLYSSDEKEVSLAYANLKKSIQMIKYAQDDLLQLIKKVYQLN